MNDSRDLRPARPDVENERPAYMPKVAWKWIFGVGSFMAMSVAVYQIREHQEANVLREDLVNARNKELAPIIKQYESVSEKVRRLTREAARKPRTETVVDPRLRLDALGSGKGLYLRLTESQIPQAGNLDEVEFDPAPDAIGRCLGLDPVPAGEVLARGSFLSDEWFKQVEAAGSVMRLRVVAEELRQRSERDLPFVVDAIDAQWFMLVIERGETRRTGPVDVYLWDLRNDELLLQTRTEASGALVAARIAVEGVKPGHYPSGAQTGAAQDCSIASQLRQATGAEVVTFASDPPAPRAALGLDAPAAEASEAAGAEKPADGAAEGEAAQDKAAQDQAAPQPEAK